MSIPVTAFQCIQCSQPVPLEETQYACPACGSLLEVHFDHAWFNSRSPQAWKDLFDSRVAGQPGPDGSGRLAVQRMDLTRPSREAHRRTR